MLEGPGLCRAMSFVFFEFMPALKFMIDFEYELVDQGHALLSKFSYPEFNVADYNHFSLMFSSTTNSL